MKQINYISIILILLISSNAFSQVSISRQVIGSTGGTASGSSIMVTSTVGETNIQTLFSVSNILTQGFQQTLKVDSIEGEIINESCIGAKNGSIYIENVPGCPGPYSIEVMTTPDSIIVGADTLSTGTYIANIIGGNGCSFSTPFFVGLDLDEACELKFYSGITPNGDGKNDVWIIENIEQFPDNYIQIFNRWGQQVWEGSNYDNTEVVWEGINSSGAEMADATYFYVAVVQGKTYKGWVELTR